MAKFPKNDIMSLVGGMVRYDLAESVGPDILLGDLLGETGPAGLSDLALGYGSAQGDPKLREAVADNHGVGPDDVVITVGGMHALFLIAFIVCDRGDEAVTTSPLFPAARAVLDTVGARVSTLPLSFDQGYRLDLDELGRHLSARTKLVSLASPQNPSGVAIPRDKVREVLALLAKTCPDAYLLLDETYREAAYGDNPVADSAVDLSPRVISCASLSKCHGVPGLRLGWAITRDAVLRDHLVVGKFNTVISCSRLDEAVALKVLQQRDRILGERRQRLAEGLARTADWAKANEGLVEWVRPDAGALCCIRLKPTVFDDAAVGRFYDVLTDEDVRVGKGTWFGEEARIFRLGFGYLSIPELEVALKGLSAAIGRAARVAA